MTTDGKPFLFLDSEGFKDIIDPNYSFLGINPITTRIVINFVKVKDQSIKKYIKLKINWCRSKSMLRQEWINKLGCEGSHFPKTGKY